MLVRVHTAVLRSAAFTSASGVKMVRECETEQSQKLSVDQVGLGRFPFDHGAPRGAFVAPPQG